jgi:hypothetical protein
LIGLETGTIAISPVRLLPSSVFKTLSSACFPTFASKSTTLPSSNFNQKSSIMLPFTDKGLELYTIPFKPFLSGIVHTSSVGRLAVN